MNIKEITYEKQKRKKKTYHFHSVPPLKCWCKTEAWNYFFPSFLPRHVILTLLIPDFDVWRYLI